MRTRPDENAVLRKAIILVSAFGCAVLCLRTIRLISVGLALGLKKHDGVGNELPHNSQVRK